MRSGGWARRGLLAWVAAWWLGACGAPPPVTPGNPAPDFARTDLDGREVSLSSFAGEVVVLNFWATWCQPCRKEFPVLRELSARPDVRVVGVSLDEGGPEPVRRFARAEGLDYPIVIGDQSLFERYDGFVIPYTLLLAPDLTIVEIYRGPVERERLERDIGGIGR